MPSSFSASAPGAPAVLDVIFIEGFRCETVIGIDHDELHESQPLVIDLHAGVTRARACDTDSINDTIDYSVVRKRLHTLVKEHRFQMLEAFAESVADILLHEFGARWVRVRVVKPKKFDDLDAVGVMIEREAEPLRPATPRGVTALQLIGAGMVPGER